jgi:RHS repeat-associated protein
LRQSFNVNNLNQLTNVTRPASSQLVISGTTSGGATNVSLTGTGMPSATVALYGDGTWAFTNATLADGNNSYTAIATDGYLRKDTNTVSVNLPLSSSYRYDLNGNLLSDGRRGFDYDNENQLIRVTITNSTRSDFAYDGKMRRRVRVECMWVSGAWVTNEIVRYIYDGNLVVQERHFVPQSGGEVLQQVISYTRGKDLSGSLDGAGGIGGLLARSDLSTLNFQPSTSHVYYHADGNGNVTCLIDTNQVVVAKYLYEPFGNIISQTGPMSDANVYRFSSKEWHQPSGLVYYLYRYYEPNLQRWINKDPKAEIGAATLRDLGPWGEALLIAFYSNPFEARRGPNLMAFAHNDPPNMVDAWGLDCLDDLVDCMSPEKVCKAAVGGPTAIVSALLGGYLGAGPHTGPNGGRRPIVKAGSLTGYGLGLVRSIVGGFVGGAVVGALGQTVGCYASYFGCLSGTPNPELPHRPPYSGGSINTPPVVVMQM